jgi:spore maturation protein CgeB
VQNMKILFLDWDCYGKNDIINVFREMGHTVDITPLDLDSYLGYDFAFIEKLKNKILKDDYHIIFTLNYHPSVSEGCKETKAKYASWIYDSPYIKLYSANIINPCNYVFTFDKFTYNELVSKGINTVYYLPLAVNTSRLNQISLSQEDVANYSSDISFVGSMYNEEHNLYDRLKDKLKDKNDDYTVGFLEGLIQSQLKIYGYNLLETCISDDLLSHMEAAMKYELEPDSFATTRYVYANYFLCRKITSLERINLLTALSDSFHTNLYTFNSKTQVGNTINKGPVDFYLDMPKVFKLSKINLNITLKSIKTGIPLRAMDIMGAGGFLLTNYQEDFFEYFEADKDFVFYGSAEELLDKADYYLKHEDERKAIAISGYQKVCQDHNYNVRLKNMLDIINI